MQTETAENVHNSPQSARGTFAPAPSAWDRLADEFVAMTMSSIRCHPARSWKTLWVQREARHTERDLLLRIKALGKTRSSRALAFLKSIYTPSRSQHDENCGGISIGSDAAWFYKTVETSEYPNAPANLRTRLRIAVDVTNVWSDWNSDRKELDRDTIERKREECMSASPAHVCIRASIAELESSFVPASL